MENLLFNRYAAQAGRADTTIWGPHRCFDGLYLALLATGDTAGGNRLLEETLGLIDRNIADELSGQADKWHLGDFAIHAVWRGYRTFEALIDHGLIKRIEQRAVTYPYHAGGMSENHNLLQHAMRYLAGSAFPDAVFHDGRTGSDHVAKTGTLIRDWCRIWLEQGSEEWGADLYENVNLLSLLNLFDFAPDTEIRACARQVLDLMAREIALNAHAGATTGAARRGYGCYRLDARLSPSRPLHWLWFDSGVEDFDVPWFIGGVLVAALSEYRPPKETVALAQSPGPLFSSDWNTRPFYQPDVEIRETFRVTTRLPGAQLSGTIIPASASRYTDFTWVACLDEKAIVLANHPRLQPPGHSGAANSAPDLLEKYARNAFADMDQPTPLWVPGNMPPGMPGDLRPGFWQGHGCAPACWMRETLLMNLFDIDAKEKNQWFHLFLPAAAFDEVVQTGQWLFARRGEGLLRIWASRALERTRKGTWADAEWRCPTPRGALVVEIGSTALSGTTWTSWMNSAADRDPRFDPLIPAVSVIHDRQRVQLDRHSTFPDALLPPRARSFLFPDKTASP
ncbi:MAG: hypothetical protein ACP5I4_17285 [Oceanipulchritudo sp.]